MPQITSFTTYDNQVLKFKEPYNYTVLNDDNNYNQIIDQTIGLDVVIPVEETRPEQIEFLVLDDLAFIYKFYACAPDNLLTEEVLEIKKNFRALLEIIEFGTKCPG